ncbi:MAG: nuclear transport factor 2 family protein [Acidimicrobiia bacterium]
MGHATSSTCVRCRIEALIVDYAALNDACDIAGLTQIFTEDARFEVRTPDGSIDVWNGRPQILEQLEDALRGKQQFHSMSNVRILEEEASGFTVESCLLLVHTPPGATPTLQLTATYRDRIVERDGALRFAERCVTVH